MGVQAHAPVVFVAATRCKNGALTGYCSICGLRFFAKKGPVWTRAGYTRAEVLHRVPNAVDGEGAPL